MGSLEGQPPDAMVGAFSPDVTNPAKGHTGIVSGLLRHSTVRAGMRRLHVSLRPARHTGHRANPLPVGCISCWAATFRPSRPRLLIPSQDQPQNGPHVTRHERSPGSLAGTRSRFFRVGSLGFLLWLCRRPSLIAPDVRRVLQGERLGDLSLYNLVGAATPESAGTRRFVAAGALQSVAFLRARCHRLLGGADHEQFRPQEEVIQRKPDALHLRHFLFGRRQRRVGSDADFGTSGGAVDAFLSVPQAHGTHEDRAAFVFFDQFGVIV